MAGLVAGLAVGACTGGDATGGEAVLGLPAQVCQRARVCGCRVDDPQQPCEQTLDDVALWLEEAGQNGLVFDEVCYDALVLALDVLPCNATLQSDCTSDCALFHGTAGLGQPCDHYAGPVLDQCRRGLRCAFGVCQDPCHVVAPAVGSPCDAPGGCAPD